MALFKFTKSSVEENSSEQNYSRGEQQVPEQNDKTADDGTVRREVPFKMDSKVKSRKGTITVVISTASAPEIARFQIAEPALFQRTIEIISGVLSQIDDPQLDISADCNCIWCQQKISEFKELLSQ
jgi:hypothetical protein